MKQILKLLITSIVIFYCSNNCKAQAKIKSANISFYTPSNDDKDWDTKITVMLYLSDGTLVGKADYNSCTSTTTDADVANCFCCIKPLYNPQGQMTDPKTMFRNGSSKGPFSVVISNQVLKQNIGSGYFQVNVSPAGNDRWIFIPSLVLNFDDGTSKNYTSFPKTIVDQDASQATLVFH